MQTNDLLLLHEAELTLHADTLLGVALPTQALNVGPHMPRAAGDAKWNDVVQFGRTKISRAAKMRWCSAPALLAAPLVAGKDEDGFDAPIVGHAVLFRAVAVNTTRLTFRAPFSSCRPAINLGSTRPANPKSWRRSRFLDIPSVDVTAPTLCRPAQFLIARFPDEFGAAHNASNGPLSVPLESALGQLASTLRQAFGAPDRLLLLLIFPAARARTTAAPAASAPLVSERGATDDASPRFGLPTPGRVEPFGTLTRPLSDALV